MNKHAHRLAAAVGAALFLGLAAAEPALAQEGGGSAVFSVDLGTVVWTWVLFLITLGILAWKVFPMISGSLEERQQKIQSAIDSAREDRDEARQLLEEHQRQLEKARQEAQEILDEGREAGKRLREEILQEAREEREEMMERTRREMEREREKLRDDIRQEAVDVAIAAAERLMRSEMDREENRRLVRDYIEQVG